jgi:hypothetical protein
VFADGQQVCQSLARVRAVGQAIHDGHRGMGRDAVQRGVMEDAEDHRVHIAAHRAAEVRERFAPAEADLVAGQEQARAAELRDGAFEAHACAQGGLLEDQRDDLPGECVRLRAGFQRGGAVE